MEAYNALKEKRARMIKELDLLELEISESHIEFLNEFDPIEVNGEKVSPEERKVYLMDPLGSKDLRISACNTLEDIEFEIEPNGIYNKIQGYSIRSAIFIVSEYTKKLASDLGDHLDRYVKCDYWLKGDGDMMDNITPPNEYWKYGYKDIQTANDYIERKAAFYWRLRSLEIGLRSNFHRRCYVKVLSNNAWFKM